MLQFKVMTSLKINLIAFALFWVITFPAYAALLHPGMLTSHDGEGHIIRMFEFNTALDDGNFPIRWSKRLNWGLGYPYFNFNYPLTYYLTYSMHKAGLDLLLIFKAILLLSFPLGGFFTFLWLKEHFSKIESFVGGLFFVLYPYHFVNVYVRGNIAETLALTFIPLGLYLVNRLHKKPNIKITILLSLCLSSIILFHNITALLFLPILFAYALLLGLRANYLKFLLLAFLSPLLITCFFWLPALYTKQFITIDQTFLLYYPKHFSQFSDLIYSPWGYGGSKVGPGQISVQVGILHLLILAASTVFAIIGFKKNHNKKLVLFFLILSAVAFFMMLEFSKPIWDMLKPIQYLQFPWRLLSILALTVSFLTASTLSFIFKFIPKNAAFLITIILILGLLIFNRNHWRANKYYDLPGYWFLDKPYSSTTTVDGEHTPKWQLENMPSETSRFKIISGQADVRSIAWKTNYHAFDIDAKDTSQILDRTVYFPGWSVFIDGKQVQRIDQNDPKTYGLIGFEVSKGKHLVEVKLLELLLYKIADGISLVGLSLAILLLTATSVKIKLR